jgi:cyclopropane fatty-acyl-phospholipid synthase-like methyltransferase
MNPFDWFLSFSALEQTLFIIIFGLVAYFGFLRAGLSLAPWVPTHKRDLKRVNELCDLKPGDTFVEAGCGNAVVTKYIAKHNPEVTCIGLEYSTIMVLWASLVAWCSGLKNLQIIYGDALDYDVRQTDVLYAYGLTSTVNEKLLPKVKAELPPGARFISYAFKIKDDAVLVDGSDVTTNIYVYTQPSYEED